MPLQCRPPTASPTSADERDLNSLDADDGGLRAFLAPLLKLSITSPPPEPGRTPVSRCWRAKAAGVNAGLRPIDRHPAFYWPDPEIPVRQVKRLSRSAKIGWRGIFQSMKNGRPMQHLSGIELGALRRYEADPEIDAFVEHPVSIGFGPRGTRRVTPSLFVRTGNEARFVVCCTEASAARPENEAKWTELGELFGRAGFGFEVLTELDQRHQPCRRNVDEILRTRWDEPVDEERARSAWITASAGAALGTVMAGSGLGRAEVLQLVRRRTLRLALDTELDNDAMVRAGEAVTADSPPDGR